MAATIGRFRLKPVHLLAGVAGIIALSAFTLKTASGFLNYFIRSVQVAWDGSTPLLRVMVAIQNPTNQKFTIRSIVGSLLINEQKAGNVSMFQTIVINPNTQNELPVIVRLDPVAVVSNLLELVERNSGNPQVIKLDAIVNANNIVSDLTMTYKVG